MMSCTSDQPHKVEANVMCRLSLSLFGKCPSLLRPCVDGQSIANAAHGKESGLLSQPAQALCQYKILAKT